MTDQTLAMGLIFLGIAIVTMISITVWAQWKETQLSSLIQDTIESGQSMVVGRGDYSAISTQAIIDRGNIPKRFIASSGKSITTPFSGSKIEVAGTAATGDFSLVVSGLDNSHCLSVYDAFPADKRLGIYTVTPDCKNGKITIKVR